MRIITSEKLKYTDESVSNFITRFIRTRPRFWAFKRTGDLIFSLFFILIVLSWLLPLISILILIDSRGPVFFIQQRVGRFGKTFYCLKFRTMHTNIEADFKQASDDDPRITRIGHFLRLTNIDELPQFLNVLMGHMSIVGPRPHMYKDCRDFNLVVKNYKLRSFVKPGITGLAQIKGFRGPTDTETSIIHRFKWDLFYVTHVSLAMDLFILQMTIRQTTAHIAKIIFSSMRSNKKKHLKDIELQGKKQIAA
ncbi:MAG: sugar transferase [Chitinophagaceae bacterium]